LVRRAAGRVPHILVPAEGPVIPRPRPAVHMLSTGLSTAVDGPALTARTGVS